MQTEMTAKNRIQQAMAHVEQAQTSLEQAVMELTAVRGMATECDRIAALRDHVKASWYVLENTLQRGLPETANTPPPSIL